VNLTSSPHYFEDNDVRTYTHTQYATCSTWEIRNRFGRNRYRLSTFLYRRHHIKEHNEQTMNCSNTSFPFPAYCKLVISSFKNEIATKWFSRKLAHVAFLRLMPYSRSTVWQNYVQRKVTLRSRI
jgi:nuclear transport factor 2 (NTF2) superfamily protein